MPFQAELSHPQPQHGQNELIDAWQALQVAWKQWCPSQQQDQAQLSPM